VSPYCLKMFLHLIERWYCYEVINWRCLGIWWRVVIFWRYGLAMFGFLMKSCNWYFANVWRRLCSWIGVLLIWACFEKVGHLMKGGYLFGVNGGDVWAFDEGSFLFFCVFWRWLRDQQPHCHEKRMVIVFRSNSYFLTKLYRYHSASLFFINKKKVI
jgi:hypothetical protein